MDLQKVGWLKKITAKQIAMMCILMVAVYFLATPPRAGNELESDNVIMTIRGLDDLFTAPINEHTLYVMHDSGHLVKTTVMANPEMSEVDSIFNSLLVDSDNLHDGVFGLIPSGAVLRNYEIVDGILTLDLSESFTWYKTSVEQNLLTSLVWSMTALNDVDHVNFLVEGEPVNNFNTALHVGRGLNRAMGINVEMDAQSMANTKPIMLYFFTDQTEDALLVPVTRLVDPHVDPFEIVISSLVRGPLSGSYISVFNHQASLIEAPFIDEGIMTLNFSSNLFYDLDQTQVSSQVIKQLVMSMTEFEEVTEVSVVIEGNSRVFDNVGNPITIPVGRNHVLGNETASY